MPLDETKTRRVLDLWQDYDLHGETISNANDEYPRDELDHLRRQTIPEVLGWLNRFLSGQAPVEEFKTAIDGINKRNRLWGFRGINGQMYFNMVTKSSLAGDRLSRLVDLLKRTLPAPQNENEMASRISELVAFTRSLAPFVQDQRAAPKVGSVPYFLSYFWQIQDPDHIPVYYISMVNALKELDIWHPAGAGDQDYVSFYRLNCEMQQLISRQAGHPVHLWDVEHAFWFYKQPSTEAEPVTQAELPLPTPHAPAHPAPPTASAAPISLPESYLPPVVSILPRLALNDPDLAAVCQQTGRSIEKVFEDRLATLFTMLGYEVEQLGQGHGRVPDGVAVSTRDHYAVIYDAKVRGAPYTMGSDERAIREYIADKGERLRRQGIRSVYFMIISSGFTGDHDDVISGIKMDTDVREVILTDASALLALLEARLRVPSFDLGRDGVQRLLARSGILPASRIREFYEL